MCVYTVADVKLFVVLIYVICKKIRSTITFKRLDNQDIISVTSSAF